MDPAPGSPPVTGAGGGSADATLIAPREVCWPSLAVSAVDAAPIVVRGTVPVWAKSDRPLTPPGPSAQPGRCWSRLRRIDTARPE